MQEAGGQDVSLRDHDYFETTDGWIFLVLGDIHPAGRVWSLLKYVPGNGIWGGGGKKFIRVIRQYTVSELLKIITFLEERQPSYVYHDPTVGARVIAPPTSSITKIYSSKKRLIELVSSPAHSRLERLLVSLVERLSEVSGIPVDCFGVTGSILPAIHHQDSDIDLVVYGRDNLWRVLEALEELHREGEVALMGGSDPEGWVIRASSRYPVSAQDLRRLASNVINKGVYRGVPFSIHGVREVPAYSYGEVVYSSLGMARVRARVVDVRESLFTPAVYSVEDGGGSINRIVCYDMMLAGVLKEGDSVEAYGKLELARRNGEEAWRQILIGSYEGAGREYIRIL